MPIWRPAETTFRFLSFDHSHGSAIFFLDPTISVIVTNEAVSVSVAVIAVAIVPAVIAIAVIVAQIAVTVSYADIAIAIAVAPVAVPISETDITVAIAIAISLRQQGQAPMSKLYIDTDRCGQCHAKEHARRHFASETRRSCPCLNN